MRNYLLIAGTAIAASAAPALAGGPGSGGLLGGLVGGSSTTIQSTSRATTNAGAGNAGNCLCQTVSRVLGAGSVNGAGSGHGHGIRVNSLASSVAGLRTFTGRGGNGGGSGSTHGFALAGVVSGSAHNLVSIHSAGGN